MACCKGSSVKTQVKPSPELSSWGSSSKPKTSKLVVLICGGGNGAHTTAGLVSSRKNMEARVMTLYGDESERWTRALNKDDFVVSVAGGSSEIAMLQSKPRIITKDPAKVVPGADIIIFTMPAFAHAQYFEAIAPYLDKNVIIVGMPGQPGFEFQCFDILKEKAKYCTIMDFESLPWAARILEFGHHVQILGTKASLQGSIITGHSKPVHGPLGSMQKIVGRRPILTRTDNYLELYLLTKSVVHPPIMYGMWKDWDGQPVAKMPLFYQGVTKTAVKCLNGISNELVETAVSLQTQEPKLIMHHVCHLIDWYRKEYADDVKDSTNLETCLKTNVAYDGLVHPMTEHHGKYEPDFKHRYLVEDVPNGLVVTKGLGLIAGVDTPFTDEVLLWCQKVMGKEYMVDFELKGKDLKETRCPQRYGYHTIADLVALL